MGARYRLVLGEKQYEVVRSALVALEGNLEDDEEVTERQWREFESALEAVRRARRTAGA